MTRLEALVEAVRRERAPEPRTSIFEIRLEPRADALAVTGVTTEPEVVGELLRRAAAVLPGQALLDEVLRLPDPALGSEGWAVVRTPLAPLHAAPDIRATQVSQYVLGAPVQALLAVGRWLRVRGEDGYLGWMNRGYLRSGGEAWARGWAERDGAEAAISLGAQLVDSAEGRSIQLPWGARVASLGGRCRLPDGWTGSLAAGQVVPVRQQAGRFPAEGAAIVESARQWLGAPYVWGGVTQAGVDCSGFVQAVLRLHGVALPRDAELQVARGAPVDPGPAFQHLRPADLLFFTEVPHHITHVALSLGGARIIHSALSNGGVGINDLSGNGVLEPELRRMLVQARRVLPAR